MKTKFDRLLDVLYANNLITSQDDDYIRGDMSSVEWNRTDERIFIPERFERGDEG